MTPYADIDGVRALNTGRTIATQTKPSASQVAGFLDDTAGVIDAILDRQGYELPIPTTATGALKLLEHFNELGGHALTEQAAPVSDREDAAMAMWENAQKMLREDLIQLDAPRELTTTLPRGPVVPSPFFTRDMEM